MAEPELVRCEHCGAMNRVATEKLAHGHAAVCGRCKSPLTKGIATPLTITDGTFAEAVEKASLLVLLDMWAPWCGPCRMVGPIVDELARELAGRVRVGKMNVDENPATSERFAIRSIPALLFFRGGQEVDRIVGAQPKAEILRRIERLLG
jgi:thioredoxin 2